jgi:hypothetical protein
MALLLPGCANYLCSLSLRERAGVRGFFAKAEDPLILSLFQRERKQGVPVKLHLARYQALRFARLEH